MKKILFMSALILTIFSTAAKGQAALLVLIFGEKAATENFHFSLKLGVNYSIINGYEGGTNRVGANFGLINNIKLNDKLSLTPEFIPLSSRGIRKVPVLTTGNPDLDDLLQDTRTTDRKLNYLDIPVLLKVKLSHRFSLSAGPQISFLTGATDIYTSEPLEGIKLETVVDIKDHVNKVDLAAAIDLMFMLSEPKKGKGVNLYIRFTQGFLDIEKASTEKRFTNTTIQIGGAFPFVSKND